MFLRKNILILFRKSFFKNLAGRVSIFARLGISTAPSLNRDFYCHWRRLAIVNIPQNDWSSSIIWKKNNWTTLSKSSAYLSSSLLEPNLFLLEELATNLNLQYLEN